MSACAKVHRIVNMAWDRLKVPLLTPHARRALQGRLPAASLRVPYAVYFADVPSSAYQLQQWIPPFETLHVQSGPVTLLVRNPLVAELVAQQTMLPVVLVDQFALVDSFVTQHNVSVLFYVNNSQSNFTALRLTDPVHVHLSHGESEKSSMYSHQLKAYDYAFVAGEASAERILRHVKGINPQGLVRIGRPQLAVQGPSASDARAPERRISVLYAPTWEGDSPRMAYGSLVTHGEELMSLLTADPRFRVVFRPHPKTGSHSPRHRAALSRIRRLLSTPAAREAGHVVDEEMDAVRSIAGSDVVVADVSAMAMDAVGLDRPLILCLPREETSSSLAAHVTVWQGGLPAEAANIAADMATAPVPLSQARYRDHVFTTADPAEAVQLFVAASQQAGGLGPAPVPGSSGNHG